MYGPQKECYAYFDPTNLKSISKALEDLKSYIEADGSFDGILGYSQGAVIAAILYLQVKMEHPAQMHPLFECAIFLSGGVPFDPAALCQDKIRFLDPNADGQPITIPTAHIWGSNDLDFPNTSPKLSKLCEADCRTEVLYDGGHEEPVLKGDLLIDVVGAIDKTLTRAVLVQ